MEIILSKTNQEFLNQYGDFLNLYPERTQLLMINVNKELDTPLLKNQFRGAVMNQGEIVLVFLNAIPYNLQLFSTKHSKEAIHMVVEYLIENLIEIRGVQGNRLNTDEFIMKYSNLTYLHFRCRLQMDIMRLNHLVEVPLKGIFRLADLHDVNPLIEIEKAFFDEALHENQPNCQIYERVRNQLSSNQIYVLTDEDDQILSTAMVSRTLYKGRAISLVYTYPKYRNQGYSRSLLYQLCSILFQQGYEFVTLFVDKTNPVSNRVYLKLGFEVVEDNYDYVIDKVA